VTDNPEHPTRIAFELQADPGLLGGVYANGLSVWHTISEFTLDFVVNSQPQTPARTDTGETVIRAPHQLVARVRIPPGKVFDVIRAINDNLTNYEQTFGPLSPREPYTPLYPPGDTGDSGDSGAQPPE
jgi:Protein of unknown function (DUF3467)